MLVCTSQQTTCCKSPFFESCVPCLHQDILYLEPQKTQSMLADPSVEAGTVKGKTAVAQEP